MYLVSIPQGNFELVASVEVHVDHEQLIEALTTTRKRVGYSDTTLNSHKTVHTWGRLARYAASELEKRRGLF